MVFWTADDDIGSFQFPLKGTIKPRARRVAANEKDSLGSAIQYPLLRSIGTFETYRDFLMRCFALGTYGSYSPVDRWLEEGGDLTPVARLIVRFNDHNKTI